MKNTNKFPQNFTPRNSQYDNPAFNQEAFTQKQVNCQTSISNAYSKNNEQESNVKSKGIFLYSYFTFFLVCSTFFSYGISNSIFGATLPLLRNNVNIDTRSTFKIISFRYMTYVACSLMTSLTYKYGRQYQFVAGVLLYASTIYCLPLTTNLTEFTIALGLYGVSVVFLDTIPILITLEIFDLNSKSYQQVVYFCFSIGAVIGPIMTTFFLNSNAEPQVQISNNSTLSNLNSTILGSSSINDEISKNQNLCNLYLVASLILVSNAVIFLILQIIRPYKQPIRKLRIGRSQRKMTIILPIETQASEVQNEDQISEQINKEDAKLPKYYKIIAILLIAIVVANINSSFSMLTNFLSMFLMNHPKFHIGQTKATNLNTYLFAATFLGRVSAIFLSTVLTHKVYICLDLFLCSSGIILMIIAGEFTFYLFQIGTCLLGLGLSSTNALFTSLLDKRVLVTNRVQGVLLISGVSHLFYLPYFIGKYIDNGQPDFFLYTLACLIFSSIILFFVFNLVDLKRTKYLKVVRNELPNRF